MSRLNGKAKAPVKSNQLGMRELVIQYTGASGDVVSGPDKDMVSVTDNGAGNYTITLNSNARSAFGQDLFVKGHMMLTEDTTMWLEAVSASAITVQCRNVDTAVSLADTDADFQIVIGVHDWRYSFA